jgi:hypothetical protein
MRCFGGPSYSEKQTKFPLPHGFGSLDFFQIVPEGISRRSGRGPSLGIVKLRFLQHTALHQLVRATFLKSKRLWLAVALALGIVGVLIWVVAQSSDNEVVAVLPSPNGYDDFFGAENQLEGGLPNLSKQSAEELTRNAIATLLEIEAIEEPIAQVLHRDVQWGGRVTGTAIFNSWS